MMRRIAAVFAAAFAATFAAGAHAAALDPVEQRIVAAIKADSPQALALLEKSVLVNSGTMNAEGVRQVGALFRAEFDALGFTTRWIELPPGMRRAGHLLATREGKRGKRLLLLGHLDTVFEPGSAAPTWERSGARIRGQGVSDMKGGDVIVIAALRALRRAGALEDASSAVLFTGDEEEAGNPRSISRGDMVELAKRSDAALGFEGNVLDKDGRPTASAGIVFHDSYPPMAVTPGNLELLDAYSRASRDAGLGAVGALPAEARGAGDIQFVTPYVDSLDGLGASGNGAHSPDEDLDAGSIERGAIRAALLSTA